MASDDDPFLRAMLAYAEAGLLVFPATPGKKKSEKAARYSNGRRWGATKDPAEIRYDRARCPHANVGIMTGRESGIFVVETDTEAHGDGVDGESALRRLIDRYGEWPNTRIACSPSGSLHYYFKYPRGGLEVYNSTSRIGPGIDVRGEGGIVIAPPSRQEDGFYRWVNKEPIRNAPQWLLGLISSRFVATSRGVGAGAALGELQCSPEYITEVVAHIKHPPGDPYEDWNNTGIRIFCATGGSEFGFKLFDEYSKRSTAGKYNLKYRADGRRLKNGITVEERWEAYRRSPPSLTGISALERQAFACDPDWEVELDRRFLALNFVGRDDDDVY